LFLTFLNTSLTQAGKMRHAQMKMQSS